MYLFFFYSSPNAPLISMFFCFACSCLTFRPHKTWSINNCISSSVSRLWRRSSSCISKQSRLVFVMGLFWAGPHQLSAPLSWAFLLLSQVQSLGGWCFLPRFCLGSTAPPLLSCSAGCWCSFVDPLSRLFGSSLGKLARGDSEMLRCWRCNGATSRCRSFFFFPTSIVFQMKSTNTGLWMLVRGHRGLGERPEDVPAGVEFGALQTCWRTACKNPSHAESHWFTPFFSPNCGLRTISEENIRVLCFHWL